MAKYNIFFKKSALKQLRLLPKSSQDLITNSISTRLTDQPYKADGKHIKKLTEGFRLRVGNYRIFYYLETEFVTITSIVRRTTTTY